MARAPELVPRRVGVAYVSLRVTADSTARMVVLEVLPLLGHQVCTLGLPVLASQRARQLPQLGADAPCGCPGQVAPGPSLIPPPLSPQAESPESFQLVEVLMGSRQGERVVCS